MSCNLNVNQIIKKYIDVGWYKLTDIFSKQKFAKEKTLYTEIDENLLKMIGAVRTYIVNKTYECYKMDNQIMIKNGSSNITSDYDINLIGKHSDITMFNMFNDFLKRYKHLLSYSFDTNIYVHSIFMLDKEIEQSGLEIQKFKLKEYPSNDFFVLKFNQIDKDICLNFSCIKLLETHKDFSKFDKLSMYISKSVYLDHGLKEIYKKKYSIMKKKYINHDKNNLEIITKYNLYYEYSKLLNDIVYNKHTCNNYQLVSSITKYFSIEGYYTQGTFNAMVLNLIESIDLKLNKIEYICSAIENLGDFVHHFGLEISSIKSKEDFEIKIIKYSKYIYRIYYSLYHAQNLSFKKFNFFKMTNEVKNKVLKYRSLENTKQKIDYMLLDYDYNLYHSDYNKYLEHIVEKFGAIINDLL